MKNNKGQALVLFIILIPIFLVIMAILVDNGINSHHKKRIDNITKNIVEILLDNTELKTINYDNKEIVKEKLKKQAIMLYEQNDINTEALFIDIGYGGEITLYNTYDHYSFINSLLGKGGGMRHITVEVVGTIEDGKKILKFKDDSDENF